MKATDLIEEVRGLGGELGVRGDRLHYRLPASVAPKMVERLRRNKWEIIAELRQSRTELVHFRPDEVITKESLRYAKDPAVRAVYDLLREDEYIDSSGRIRRVQ